MKRACATWGTPQDRTKNPRYDESDLILTTSEINRDFADGNRGVQKELTVVANWFFHGHRNKLTVDVSFVTVETLTDIEVDEAYRFRVQWDISF